MINLLKKDLIACFKTDTKTIIKLLIGLFIFSSILYALSSITIPLFISYIFIIRSFQLDEMNKCDYFFNSLPIDKEDVVYSKYLLSTIIIIISLIFTFIYSKVMRNFWGISNFNLDIALSILSTVLFSISILFPIVFRYGYKKSYVLLNLIIGVVLILSIFTATGKQVTSISELDKVSKWDEYSLFIRTGVSMVMYLISMWISNKIYMKKEIAN